MGEDPSESPEVVFFVPCPLSRGRQLSLIEKSPWSMDQFQVIAQGIPASLAYLPSARYAIGRLFAGLYRHANRKGVNWATNR